MDVLSSVGIEKGIFMQRHHLLLLPKACLYFGGSKTSFGRVLYHYL